MTDSNLPYVSELKDNFLRYVAVSSESDPKTGCVPSSEGQRELAKLLAEELKTLGLVEIELNEHAILTALLPANVEGAPAVGWVAHLDTVPVSLSPDVKAPGDSLRRRGTFSSMPKRTFGCVSRSIRNLPHMRVRTSSLRTARACSVPTTRRPLRT